MDIVTDDHERTITVYHDGDLDAALVELVNFLARDRPDIVDAVLVLRGHGAAGVVSGDGPVPDDRHRGELDQLRAAIDDWVIDRAERATRWRADDASCRVTAAARNRRRR